ncbi:uncharacterized protein LOC124341376 isoform X2 [Daphnia pulicaria]|uniref:uncharacterized protein LOC124341376 isoform X2 n=1 Tax=Daphnia pulicaria TaxID=35523 RepID=UPI001EEB9596|nr:uncharacterized protein LOC124341376 isoform X2 [Daphnia pulicaria]
MGALFMQKVQQLILNPESCSLTVFPLPEMMSSGCSTQSQCTVIPEARLQARNASDSDNSQVQTKVFPRQPRAYSSAILAQFIHLHLSTIKDLLYVSGHHSTVSCSESEVDAVIEKEKKPSFQGLDDFTKRNGDWMTSTPVLTESNKFRSTGVSLWMPYRRQFS